MTVCNSNVSPNPNVEQSGATAAPQQQQQYFYGPGQVPYNPAAYGPPFASQPYGNPNYNFGAAPTPGTQPYPGPSVPPSYGGPLPQYTQQQPGMPGYGGPSTAALYPYTQVYPQPSGYPSPYAAASPRPNMVPSSGKIAETGGKLPPQGASGNTVFAPSQPHNIMNDCETGMASDDKLYLTDSIDIQLRHGFIRKVYGMLTVQLLITFGLVALVGFVPPVTNFFLRYPALGLAAIISAFVITLLLSCFTSVCRAHPWNVILLSLLSVFYGIGIGYIATRVSPTALLMAAGLTAALAFAVSIFACQTKMGSFPCRRWNCFAYFWHCCVHSAFSYPPSCVCLCWSVAFHCLPYL